MCQQILVKSAVANLMKIPSTFLQVLYESRRGDFSGSENMLLRHCIRNAREHTFVTITLYKLAVSYDLQDQ